MEKSDTAGPTNDILSAQSIKGMDIFTVSNNPTANISEIHQIEAIPSTVSAVTLTVAEKGQIEKSSNVEEGGQEAAAWVSSEKSAYSKHSKHLLCLAWANVDQIN